MNYKSYHRTILDNERCNLCLVMVYNVCSLRRFGVTYATYNLYNMVLFDEHRNL